MVDEVSYSDGGQWGTWSDGGGSSLELVDPHSDNMRPTNWADSDETAKGQWAKIEYTGLLDNGRNTADELQILLRDEGEALIDDIEVVKLGETTNRVANGTFESGLGGWVIQGTHVDSVLKTNEGHTARTQFSSDRVGRRR